MRTRRALPGVALGAALVAALVAGGLVAPGPTSAAAAAGPDPLFLVTLEGTGTAGRSQVVGEAGADRMHRRRDAVLATVGADAPVYRWTTALDGVAVHLPRQQVV